MRIGFVQIEPKLGETEANRALVEAALLAAPEAELLVLPELCSSGYNFAARDDAWRAAEEVDGPFVSLLTSLARRRGTHYVAGLAERSGQSLFNSAALVGPSGLLGLYRKAHLFLNEKDLFQPGDLGFPVFAIGELRVGILICFDWQFPEAWRVLALSGADVVAHPSNLVLPGRAQRAVPIHAMANRVFAVTANRIGTERGLGFTGCSIVADPRGEVLATAAADAASTQVVAIDLALARDKQVTARNHLLADRRPELYGPLTEESQQG